MVLQALLILAFHVVVDGLPPLGTIQSAAVRGVLLCNGKPSVGTKVKLYDVDTLDPDDLLDQGVTDDAGRFELHGHETEITPIDPKLNIYHACNDETLPCLRKISIYLPKDFITEGKVAKKIFDAGVLNLSGRFSGESRDCIN